MHAHLLEIVCNRNHKDCGKLITKCGETNMQTDIRNLQEIENQIKAFDKKASWQGNEVISVIVTKEQKCYSIYITL